MVCRDWLRENGYADVADLIDCAVAKIEAKGKKLRRNWWDTLAGKPGGKPSVREGIAFPILRVAQLRQGKPVTPNAVWRNENEVPPGVVKTQRWAMPEKAKTGRPLKAVGARARKPASRAQAS